MSRAQDAVERAIKEIDSEAKRIRAEIDKQRKDLEKRIKPLQGQLSDLEDALRRLVRRDGHKPAAKKRPRAAVPPRGQQAGDPRRPQQAARRVRRGDRDRDRHQDHRRQFVTDQLAKQGEVKRTKRNGRVTWKTAA